MKNINRLFTVIDNSLSRVTGKLDYTRITQAITKLANRIQAYDGETESIWYIGENGEYTLDDLIVGAYWHYTEWHGGQWSEEYAALSALGQVFNPGMTSCEPDNMAYQALNELVGKH